MFKHILAEGGNINWMAIFALLTFFLLFVISAVAIFGKRKSYIQKMAGLPLENDSLNPEKLENEK